MSAGEEPGRRPADRAVVDTGGVRARARIAREESRHLIATSVAMIERSRELVSRTFSRAVIEVDRGNVPWNEATAAFIRAGARWHGRDPAIEEAKTVLSRELRISRGDAYGVLCALSQRQRRSVREIAGEIAGEG